MSDVSPCTRMMSATWLPTIAGNQRTSSRACARSSETFDGTHTRQRSAAGVRPLELDLGAFPVHRAPVYEGLDHRATLLEHGDRRGLAAHHPHRAVPAAD